eukprot:g20574.t1
MDTKLTRRPVPLTRLGEDATSMQSLDEDLTASGLRVNMMEVDEDASNKQAEDQSPVVDGSGSAGQPLWKQQSYSMVEMDMPLQHSVIKVAPIAKKEGDAETTNFTGSAGQEGDCDDKTEISAVSEGEVVAKQLSPAKSNSSDNSPSHRQQGEGGLADAMDTSQLKAEVLADLALNADHVPKLTDGLRPSADPVHVLKAALSAGGSLVTPEDSASQVEGAMQQQGEGLMKQPTTAAAPAETKDAAAQKQEEVEPAAGDDGASKALVPVPMQVDQGPTTAPAASENTAQPNEAAATGGGAADPVVQDENPKGKGMKGKGKGKGKGKMNKGKGKGKEPVDFFKAAVGTGKHTIMAAFEDEMLNEARIYMSERMGRFLIWLKEKGVKATDIWANAGQPVGSAINDSALLYMLMETNPNVNILDLLQHDLSSYVEFGPPMQAILGMRRGITTVTNGIESQTGCKGEILKYLVLKSGKIPKLNNFLAGIGVYPSLDGIRDDVLEAKGVLRKYRLASPEERKTMAFPCIDRMRQVAASDMQNEVGAEVGLTVYNVRACVRLYDFGIACFIEEDKDMDLALNAQEGKLTSKQLRASIKNCKTFKQKFEDAKRLKAEELAYKKAKQSKKKEEPQVANLVVKSAFPQVVLDIHQAAIDFEDSTFRQALMPNFLRQVLALECVDFNNNQIKTKPLYKGDYRGIGLHGKRLYN